MKTTLEIPVPETLGEKKLLERIWAKGELDGVSNPTVNESLRQAWLDSAVSFSPDDSGWSPEERKRRAEEWMADLKAFAIEINRNPEDPRPPIEILMEGRNRLENLHPAQDGTETPMEGRG